jgi:PAS domain S-box-containing protein
MASSLTVHPDFYKCLAENTFDGIMQVDIEGYIVAWNRGAERMFGHTATNVIGTRYQDQSIKQLAENGAMLPSARLPVFLTLRDGQFREDHAYIQHLEGYQISVLIRVLPILNYKNKIVGAMQIFTDSKALIAAREERKRVSETILRTGLDSHLMTTKFRRLSFAFYLSTLIILKTSTIHTAT